MQFPWDRPDMLSAPVGAFEPSSVEGHNATDHSYSIHKVIPGIPLEVPIQNNW